MSWISFKRFPKKVLGIDIGTSAIKIVELAKAGDKIRLSNYGEMTADPVRGNSFRSFEQSTLLLSNKDISWAIRSVLEAAKIETKESYFSIPDFSSFFTTLNLPPMTQQEIPSAVQFTARRHIPLPLAEVALDWSVLQDEAPDGKTEEGFKVLLVAVPHEIINQYQEIAELSQIQLLALEAEVFALIRSLVKNKKEGLVGLVDIGAQSTTISIVEKGVLRATYSIDISGNELTKVLSKSFNISYNEAEEFKKYGPGLKDEQIKRIFAPLLNLMFEEAKRVLKNFFQEEGKKPEKIILAGGTALIPGFAEYFSQFLKKEIEVGNPFSGLVFPQNLEDNLRHIGPSFAIAVGMALRGFETQRIKR